MSPAPQGNTQQYSSQDAPGESEDEGSSSSLMSPSMEQFKHRDPKNIPYWSPATKLSYADTESSQSNSNLAASASVFVPTFGSEAAAGGSDGSGMNSAASEWRPPAASSSSSSSHHHQQDQYQQDHYQRQHQHQLPEAAEQDQEQEQEQVMPVYHTAHQEDEPLVEVGGLTDID